MKKVIKPIPEWKKVLRKAWSVRLMLLAALLTAAEAILPLFAQSMPRGPFALATLVVIVAAFIARFVAQKGMIE